jgi:hypothetical protein
MGDDGKSMCDQLLDMPQITCLYFGVVLLLLLLVIMQLWKVGYYASEHAQGGHVSISPADASTWLATGNNKDPNTVRFSTGDSASNRADSNGMAAGAEHFDSNLPEYLVNNRGEPDFWTITSDLDAYKTSRIKKMAAGAAANAKAAANANGAPPAAAAAAGNAAGNAAAAGADASQVAGAAAGAAAANGAAPAAAAAAGAAASEHLTVGSLFSGAGEMVSGVGNALGGGLKTMGGAEHARGAPGSKSLRMYTAGTGAENFGNFEHALADALIGN